MYSHFLKSILFLENVTNLRQFKTQVIVKQKMLTSFGQKTLDWRNLFHNQLIVLPGLML
jgi:hypothetical protein